jgi:hypothetical protein
MAVQIFKVFQGDKLSPGGKSLLDGEGPSQYTFKRRAAVSRVPDNRILDS